LKNFFLFSKLSIILLDCCFGKQPRQQAGGARVLAEQREMCIFAAAKKD